MGLYTFEKHQQSSYIQHNFIFRCFDIKAFQQSQVNISIKAFIDVSAQQGQKILFSYHLNL